MKFSFFVQRAQKERNKLSLCVSTFCILTFSLGLKAQLLSSFYHFSGQLTDSSDQPVLDNSVEFTVTVLNPAENCIIYEEVISGVDLSATNGNFSLLIGKSTATRTAKDLGLNAYEIFSNNKSVNCSTSSPAVTYTPTAGDYRNISVTVDAPSLAATETLPSMSIGTTPSAIVASTLQGYKPSDFIQLSSSGNAGIGTATPENSALFELKSTDQGFLPPRMTSTQRDAISSPSTGLVVFDSDAKDLSIFDGSSWQRVGGDPNPAAAKLKTLASEPVGSTSGEVYFNSSDNQLYLFNGSAWNPVVSGETNTASNVGVSGVGVFKQKSTFNFEFKNINGGTGLLLNDDTSNNEIDIAVDVGTDPNKIVQLDGSARLPAVDGSLLTNVLGTDSTKLPLAGGTMSGQLNMGSIKIINLANPENVQDAATKAYVDSAITTNNGSFIGKSGDTMSGALVMSTNKITSLGEPTASQDAATKNYVDASVSALSLGEVNTASNIGTSGIGVFKQKNVLDFEFKKVNAGTGILLNDDTSNNKIDVAVNVGTTANQIVQLDGSSRLPAVDGSQLTNIDDSTKVSKSGDTMTGSLVLPSNGLNVGSGELVVSGSKVGVGTTTPETKLDVQGEVKLGSTGSACSASKEGALRYNSTLKTMEYCNGTDWSRVDGQSASNQVPAGAVVSMMTSACPTGYLTANGQAVSRTTESDLFAAIGTSYGAGDGSTTFNLPDLRGYFLRGVDSGAGRDPDAASRTDRGDGTTGDAVGTTQGDGNKGHSHAKGTLGGTTSTDGDHSHGYIDRHSNTTQSDNGDGAISISSHSNQPRTTDLAGAHSHTLSITGSTAVDGIAESRPKNINVLYCIKN